MRYANVYEAFHNAPASHAHGSLDDTGEFSVTRWEDSDGAEDTTKSNTATPTKGDKLYDTNGDKHIATHDGTEWKKANLADITMVEDLRFLLTNSKTFNYGLAGVLSEQFNSENYDKFLYHSVNDFLKATHSIKDSEEINAINSYVSNLQKDENSRLIKLGDKFRNNVLTTKQMYMMVNRDAHKIRSNIRILMFSIVFASVVMCLLPSHRATWAKVLIALAILVFFTYVVLHVRKDRSRRFNDFSKYFFSKGDLPDSKTEESSTTEDGDEEDETGGTC